MQVTNSKEGLTITAILRWVHSGRRQAHCLVRTVVPEAAASPTVVVFSELASNPDEVGIVGDVAGAANTWLRVLRAHAPVDPAAVVWIVHHGPFSSPDPTGPETYTQVTMDFDGRHYTEDKNLQGQQLLDDDARRLLGLPLLQPIEHVLQRFP